MHAAAVSTYPLLTHFLPLFFVLLEGEKIPPFCAFSNDWLIIVIRQKLYWDSTILHKKVSEAQKKVTWKDESEEKKVICD